jgi:protein-S-isoprenylcysteine O-methyltransferase Ste14
MSLGNLPALLIGLILCAYWARVLHLARKIRQSAGHTANVIPPGRVGCVTRAIWFPVVYLWIAIPLLTPWISNLLWIVRPLMATPLLSWAALAIAILAFILTLVCWKKMGKSWRMGIDPSEKTSLVVTGPFSRIRHPIYAISSVLMLTTVAIVPTPLMIAVALVHLTLLQLEARREENYLAGLHGQSYLDYCARTGRFFPKL